MRGARTGGWHHRRGIRIIPADAGSTYRLSGKDEAGRGSSPRMRGALIWEFFYYIILGIIPADAGSTVGQRFFKL